FFHFVFLQFLAFSRACTGIMTFTEPRVMLRRERVIIFIADKCNVVQVTNFVTCGIRICF
ncbi:MAG: hypothetical protein FWH52_06330, partial [Synergistaceae bacterium]|nr:hypothetical protein [Synergistaceae bacterium]